MEDKTVVLLVVSMMIVVIVVSALASFLLIRKLRRLSDRPLSIGETGNILVPVRRLKRTLGFFGSSGNGLSPRLEITSDGLLFKVFKVDHWLFADIAEIDWVRLPFVTRVSIRNRSRARLYADFHNLAAGRDFLKALPSNLPLAPRATEMRDGAGR